MLDQIVIRRGDVDEIVDLRWKILRAGLPRDTAHFDGDREVTTRHLVALEDNTVVGCVTFLRRPWQDRPAWQMRGMAVTQALQRCGIGQKLIEEVERTIRAENFSMQVWCNARTPAVQFYRRLGWETVGDEFVIPTAGPHYKMTKLLQTDADFVR